MLHDLASHATAALGDRLVAVYAVGDALLGDPDAAPQAVVVTDGRVVPVDPAVGGVRTSWAPTADLRSPMTLGRRWPHVDADGLLGESAHHNTAATRWVLREHGVAVLGPPPVTLVAEVPATALRAEALGQARARAEALEDDGGTSGHDDVLAWVRLAHTAEHGTVVSARDAGRWALAHLDHLGARHRDVLVAGLAARDRGGRVPVTRELAWDVVRLTGEAALRTR